MARVPYLEPSDLAPEDQDLLKRPISLFKALVNSPKAARAFSGLGSYIRYGSKLDPRLRELAILQVGWLARSPYEWSHHVKLGHDFGVTDDDIQALIDDTAGKPTGLDTLSQTVLRAAREMTEDGAMAEATFAELQSRTGQRKGGGPDADDRLLQRRRPRAGHAADRRRTRLPAVSGEIPAARLIASPSDRLVPYRSGLLTLSAEIPLRLNEPLCRPAHAVMA